MTPPRFPVLLGLILLFAGAFLPLVSSHGLLPDALVKETLHWVFIMTVAMAVMVAMACLYRRPAGEVIVLCALMACMPVLAKHLAEQKVEKSFLPNAAFTYILGSYLIWIGVLVVAVLATWPAPKESTELA